MEFCVSLLEGVPGFGNGELPVDFDTFALTFLHQSQYLTFQNVPSRDAAVEALAREGGELELDHGEPGGTFRRKEELEALGKRKGFFWLEGLLKRTHAMGVEVVLHKTNGMRVGILSRQVSQKESIFSLGALLLQVDQTLSGQRFEGA